MKIVINPGHFNPLDSGACGRYSCEAALVEEVAKIVYDDLKLAGYNVLIVHENELEDIVEQSNNFNADIFCSIHMNACNHSAYGTETYYYYGSEFGYMLAKCLQHQLLATMHSFNRGVKEAGFYVIKHTNAIAALCELDFIDNPERENYMNEHISDMAHAIARGITDYTQEIEVWD